MILWCSLLVSKFLISFALTSLSIGTKENSIGFLKYCFIFKMLRYLLYFFIAPNNGPVSSPFTKQDAVIFFQYLMCSQCYQKTSEKFQLFLPHLSKLCHFLQVLFYCSETHLFGEKWRYCFPE